MTGVQTCALPILTSLEAIASAVGGKAVKVGSLDVVAEATREALFTP